MGHAMLRDKVELLREQGKNKPDLIFARLMCPTTNGSIQRLGQRAVAVHPLKAGQSAGSEFTPGCSFALPGSWYVYRELRHSCARSAICMYS